MVRCALTSSCLLLALTACGGSGKMSVGHPTPTACSTTMPDATTWDGTGPAAGSVMIIQPAPPGQSPTHGDSALVAYEVDPERRTVTRQIVDDPAAIWKMMITVITNPKDNAGTLAILRPPPPPPDPPIHNLIADAVRVRPPTRIVPCEQMPQEPVTKF